MLLPDNACLVEMHVLVADLRNMEIYQGLIMATISDSKPIAARLNE
jgi:hypothetical protein